MQKAAEITLISIKYTTDGLEITLPHLDIGNGNPYLMFLLLSLCGMSIYYPAIKHPTPEMLYIDYLRQLPPNTLTEGQLEIIILGFI
jgi:hypothetical protein